MVDDTAHWGIFYEPHTSKQTRLSGAYENISIVNRTTRTSIKYLIKW